MTPMTLDEVRALCDMATYRNAEQIAAGDQLLHLARSDTTLYAQVQGSKPYTVRIEFKDGARSKPTPRSVWEASARGMNRATPPCNAPCLRGWD